MIFSIDIPLCARITDSFITPSVHNTQDDKYIFTTTTGFGLPAPVHHQVSLTGLDQSQGQDLVLLQYILKVTIYFYSHKFYHMVERVKSEGREGWSCKNTGYKRSRHMLIKSDG